MIWCTMNIGYITQKINGNASIDQDLSHINEVVSMEPQQSPRDATEALIILLVLCEGNPSVAGRCHLKGNNAELPLSLTSTRLWTNNRFAGNLRHHETSLPLTKKDTSQSSCQYESKTGYIYIYIYNYKSVCFKCIINTNHSQDVGILKDYYTFHIFYAGKNLSSLWNFACAWDATISLKSVIEIHYKPTAIKMSAYGWQTIEVAQPSNCSLFIF